MSYCIRCYGFDCSCDRRPKRLPIEFPHIEIKLPEPIRTLDTVYGARDIGMVRGSRVDNLLGQDTGMRVGPGTMCGDRMVQDVMGRTVGRLDMMGNLRPLI